MGFFDLFAEEEPNKEKQKEVRKEGQDTEFANEAHLDLRQEELDIHKQRVETGDVELHKEIVEEEKEVNVPVAHDQVIIERKAVDREPSEEPISTEETVHIPVTAEKVDVEKHTVVTGEVTAHKRSVEETQQVHDVLHKEVADVEGHGDAEIINED
ncbi:YsnF/AvaK domain-containing protein [Alkalihalophilus lindianensis]|uniref:YsnF/AvaK domain-containing protein n=1 Tax=Alkalihalophilus lindianensis TaxID=1630542 RepID=A0ABU3XDY3_9BACI|nr:YsnF/AvaK domain-containing protein [Alkalihalophilus lindianensis]MDV2686100.1 YsnF/AvaK domain-containing protein [Alkalihalophilus lindianensis]